MFKTVIDALLRELRSRHPGDANPSLKELAEQHQLSESVVERIALSEGFRLTNTAEGNLVVDAVASARDLDPEEVRAACSEEDPGWVEADTGVWRRNRQTNEWECLGDDPKK